MPVIISCLLGVTAFVWLAVSLISPFVRGDGGNRIRAALVCLGALTLAGAAIGDIGFQNTGFTLPRPFFLGMAAFGFRLDGLACWFLGVIGLVAAPVAAYIPAYMDHVKRRVDMRIFNASLPALLLSMSVVVMAANVLTFLVAWEIMSLSSFLLVAGDHREPATRRAALIYICATRVGTAFLAGGFLWAYALTGSWEFTDWHLIGVGALGPGLLILIGLGVKAGMWPVHLWLPIAHPAAPSPVSALMSGVMVKAAIYMIVRLFVLPGAFLHPWLGYSILTLGAISAFWGILFALLQHDLKRVLAYSTVENTGIILICVGVGMIARDLGLATIARIAIAAGLFHVLNHALFKSLLFMGAGAVDSSTGTRDLESLGGLGRRMPMTFACFVLGSTALCALPPLNGFASEWLLYQGLLGLAAGGDSPAIRFIAMILIGWIALVGVLAMACFVKTSGVAFLGRPRSERAEFPHESTASMYVPQVLLGAGCVALGLIAPYALNVLHSLVAPLEPGGSPLTRAWTLPIPSLVIVMGATAGVVALWLRSAAGRQPAKSYITWECGFGPLTSRMQATATSFAQPIARMFGVLYRYDVHRQIEGEHRRLFPEEIRAEPKTEVMLESRVYVPIVQWVDKLADRVAGLHAGSIHVYLLTMFATLIVLLIIGGNVR